MNTVKRYVTRLAASPRAQILLGTIVVWRLLLEVVNHIVPRIRSIQPAYPPDMGNINTLISQVPFGLGRWANWDGYHYLGVITQGYHPIYIDGIYREAAFFPGFPVLIRGVSKILPINSVIIGLTVNFLLTVITMAAVYKLALTMSERYQVGTSLINRKIALVSVLTLISFPASLFFAAFYSDALLVAAFTSALYFGLNKQYALAAVCAFIASLTKVSGVVLLPALLLIVLENESIRWYDYRKFFTVKFLKPAVTVTAGVLLGLGTFLAYLQTQLGDPLLFNKAQILYGRGTDHTFFLKRLWEVYYSHFFQPAYFGYPYGYMSMLIVMLLPFVVLSVTTWYGFKHRAYWVPVVSLFLVVLPLSSGGVMQSFNRYMLMLTPFFVALASLLVTKKVNKYFLFAMFVMALGLQLFFAGGFLQGSYFAG